MTKFQAIAQCRCPRCREGKMFPYTAYNLKEFSTTNVYCSSCNFKFEIEPGFFWGAMYFSYALMIAESGIAGFLAYSVAGGQANPLVYISAIVFTVICLIPINFRLSRSLMLHLFGEASYQGKK